MVEPITMTVVAAKTAAVATETAAASGGATAVAGTAGVAGTSLGAGAAASGVGVGAGLGSGVAGASTGLTALATESSTAIAGTSKVAEGLSGLAAAKPATAGLSSGCPTEAFLHTMESVLPTAREAALGRADLATGTIRDGLGGKVAVVDTKLPPISSPLKDGLDAVSQFGADAWKAWRPPNGEVIRPPTIAERFRPLQSVDNLESFAKDLVKTNDGFAREMQKYGDQYKLADAADRDAILAQVRRGPAGKLAEAVTKDGFGPFFKDVSTQVHVQTPNGASYIDAHCKQATNPLVLGREHGVAAGGNLSLEAKVGQPAYLSSQIDHVVSRQVPGHLAVGDNSLVVVSRDVYAMSGERLARAAVRGAGSHVMALLPEKAVIDEALRRILSAQVGGLS